MLPGDKVENRRREVMRLFGHRDVAHAGEKDDLGSADCTLVPLGEAWVHDRVALAPYEKRRRLDRRELTAQGLIAEELSTSAIHRPRACPDGVGRSHPEESRPNVPECDCERHGILAQAVALEDCGRRDEYEMVDQKGPGCCDPCADGASQRVSNQGDTLNANPADQRADI